MIDAASSRELVAPAGVAPAGAVGRAWVVLIFLLTACSGGSSLGPIDVSPRPPGPLGDTWTHYGSKWKHVNVSGPSPRYFAALAYDAPRHVFVLFGGQTADGTAGDTWTWDPGTSKWTARSPVHRPPPRRDAAMAYDPGHQVVVLYGGLIPDQGEGRDSSDTWTWDGEDWTEVGADTSGPGDRTGARMVTAGDRVLMFGGHIFNTSYFGDAWAWDGVRWSRVDHGPAPDGRTDAAVAWDTDDSSLFVYGGRGIRPNAGPGNLGVPRSDAWLMQNGAWRQLPSAGPRITADASAIWDRKTNSTVVIFGISCPELTTGGSSWDGGRWSSVQIGATPRWGAAVTQDDEGDVLVFGGSDESEC